MSEAAADSAEKAGTGRGWRGPAGRRPRSRPPARHDDVVVNKRAVSVKRTTRHERWDNGWRVAHGFEQRGNTVLAFRERSAPEPAARGAV